MKRFLTALLLGALVISTACAENTAPVFDFGTRTVQLNNGRWMPILGLGTWTLDDDETENAVYHALADGYRLIDTAAYYGNQKGVGNGVRRAIAEGIVTREEVFITTTFEIMKTFCCSWAAVAEPAKTAGAGTNCPNSPGRGIPARGKRTVGRRRTA